MKTGIAAVAAAAVLSTLPAAGWASDTFTVPSDDAPTASTSETTALSLSARSRLAPKQLRKKHTKVKVVKKYGDGWVKKIRVKTPGATTVIRMKGAGRKVRKIKTPKTVRVAKRVDEITVVTKIRARNGRLVALKKWRKVHKTGRGGDNSAPKNPNQNGNRVGLNPDPTLVCHTGTWYYDNMKPEGGDDAFLKGRSDAATIVRVKRDWVNTLMSLYNDPRCVFGAGSYGSAGTDDPSTWGFVGNGLGQPIGQPFTYPTSGANWGDGTIAPYYENPAGFAAAQNETWNNTAEGAAMQNRVVDYINDRRATECSLPPLPYNNTWVKSYQWASHLDSMGGDPLFMTFVLHNRVRRIADWADNTSGVGTREYPGWWGVYTPDGKVPAGYEDAIFNGVIEQIPTGTDGFCSSQAETAEIAVHLRLVPWTSPADGTHIESTVWMLER